MSKKLLDEFNNNQLKRRELEKSNRVYFREISKLYQEINKYNTKIEENVDEMGKLNAKNTILLDKLQKEVDELKGDIDEK